MAPGNAQQKGVAEDMEISLESRDEDLSGENKRKNVFIDMLQDSLILRIFL